MTDARDIAQQMTAAVHAAWAQHRESQNPAPVVETPAEAEPAIGPGNHIPGAGNQPTAPPTREQLIALAEQSGDRKLATELANELLRERFEQAHGPQPHN
ncbi:hypothetical protein [Mycolicibacterium fortuitum]|uniref:hypothetical protein n=1 Tax=Mycolicibacterium fortuitum TaxID=1766 RepID=UPI00149043A4|nr:hypothetical protein [Mycolicibacterium fortuitum]